MTYRADFVNCTAEDYFSSTSGEVQKDASPPEAYQPSHHEFIVVDPAAPPDPRPFLLYKGPNATPSRAWQEDPYRARRAPHVRQQASIGEAQPPSTFSTFQVDMCSSDRTMASITPNRSLARPESHPDVNLPIGPISEIKDALTSALSGYTPRPSRPLLKQCRFLAPPTIPPHRCRAKRPDLLFPTTSWSTARRYVPHTRSTTSYNRQPWLTSSGWPAGISKTPRSRASGERARWSSFFAWDFEAAMAASAFAPIEQSDDEEDECEDEDEYMEDPNDLEAPAEHCFADMVPERLPSQSFYWRGVLEYCNPRVSQTGASLVGANNFYGLAPVRYITYLEDGAPPYNTAVASLFSRAASGNGGSSSEQRYADRQWCR